MISKIFLGTVVVVWMPQALTGDKSTLVKVMSWCRQATSHYLNQCWPRSMSTYGVMRPQCLIGVRNYKNTFTLSVISQHSDGTDSWNSFLWEYKNPLILHSQHNGCYNPGDARNLGTSGYDFDVVIPRYSGFHYCDVIMGAMASQFTSLMIVYSTIHSGADQRKHQCSASLAFVWGIHWWAVNSSHKWPVKRKMFPFDDIIMSHWLK